MSRLEGQEYVRWMTLIHLNLSLLQSIIHLLHVFTAICMIYQGNPRVFCLLKLWFCSKLYTKCNQKERINYIFTSTLHINVKRLCFYNFPPCISSFICQENASWYTYELMNTVMTPGCSEQLVHTGWGGGAGGEKGTKRKSNAWGNDSMI